MAESTGIRVRRPAPRRPTIVLSEPEYSERRFDVSRGLVVGAICVVVTMVVVAFALALRPSTSHAIDSYETTPTTSAASTTTAPTLAPVPPVRAVATTTTVVATTAPPSTSPTTVKKKRVAKTKSPTTVEKPDAAPATAEPTTVPPPDTAPTTTTAPVTVPDLEAARTSAAPTTTSSSPVTTQGSAAVSTITPGAFCSAVGTHGSYNGVSYVCSLENAAGEPYPDQRARWRQG